MKNQINRRKVVAGLGVAPVAAVIGIPTSGAAQAMTPLERIKHHLKELEAAFLDYYPDSTIHTTFNTVLGQLEMLSEQSRI
jgi:hypothetical protein